MAPFRLGKKKKKNFLVSSERLLVLCLVEVDAACRSHGLGSDFVSPVALMKQYDSLYDVRSACPPGSPHPVLLLQEAHYFMHVCVLSFQ